MLLNTGTTQVAESFQRALLKLEQAPRFARPGYANKLVYAARKLLLEPGGAEAVFAEAHRFEAAGLFDHSDWACPERLQSRLVPVTIKSGNEALVVLELLSELRLLAGVTGRCQVTGLSTEQAEHFLKEVLALCLEYVFVQSTEESRSQAARFRLVHAVMSLIAEQLGYEDLLGQLVEEIWRLLRQRPIRVEPAREMITRLSVYCFNSGGSVYPPPGAESLISALYGPAPACREDPGLDVYRDRLQHMDTRQLADEAGASARSMWDTGLVSSYHAVLLRYLALNESDLVTQALGLSSTGTDCLLCYRDLVYTLIDRAVYAETSQAVFGLASTLERAVLHQPSVPESLWRQLNLPLSDQARQRIELAYGTEQPADVFLNAGVLSILGLPVGVGQGDNPTCQAARALSFWSYSSPDYLLQLLAWASRDDNIQMSFHDRKLNSRGLPAGGAGEIGVDLDPVSLILSPHLDRVYGEMSRLAEGRGEDPHIHVNPEFHGWRVGRGFAIAVDINTGKLKAFDAFVRLFFANYHPAYNGGHPVVHPVLVGIAATDSLARFIGWHAITILRVALDASGATRVYFYNPNNDKGQNWGNGIQVATEGHGEFYGESSLPFNEFVSRLYLFHYDPVEVGDPGSVPSGEVQAITEKTLASWAVDR